MPTTLPKLRGRIVEKYGSIVAFCEANNLSKNTVYAKILGERNMTKKDIEQWAEILGISKSDYYNFFF